MADTPASPQYSIVLVTAPSQELAITLGHTLVTEGLAACTSFLPITSIYTWNGEVHQAQEWQLIIKTDLQSFVRLESRIRQLHTYEVPEIIALPIIAGSQPYLQWIANHVQPIDPNQRGSS